MNTKMHQPLAASSALLLGSFASILNATAGWTPPQGSVLPPSVVVVGTLTDPYSYPAGLLAVGPDGAIYGGTTFGANPSPYGTLFKLQPDGTLAQLHAFNGSDGANPGSDLFYPTMVVGSDGALYGGTGAMGTGLGTLFKLQTDGTFSIVHKFTDGEGPDTGLITGPDGAFYGITLGGSFNVGMVFRLGIDGTYTELHSFNSDDGSLIPDDGSDNSVYRASGLVVGPDGALYGTTPRGGLLAGAEGGTLFKLQLDGTFTKLHDFDYSDGYGSKSALVVGSDGALYGMTEFGGSLGIGTLYKVDTNGTFTLINSSIGSAGSSAPALIKGSDGAIYGGSAGELFKVETNGNFTVLSTEGGSIGPMVVGPDGALYGSTSGFLFRLETDGTFTKLYDFANNGIGAGPGPLVLGPDMAFYGMTRNNTGAAVFKLVLPFTRPLIESLSPSQATAGSGDVSVSINGIGFLSGARVFFDNVEVAVTYVGTTNLQVVVPVSAQPSPVDFATVQVTVLNPGGGVSKPAAFTVVSPSVSGTVSQVQSGVAAAGETATVQAPPSDPASAGVSASLQNSGGTTPATVTVASYTQNPTPSPAFNAGGGFVDLQVSGASPNTQLSSSFYYPQTVTGTAEAALTLQFFNGSQWITVLSSGGAPPNKNTTDNLDGTTSGGRFQVVFDSTSTPPITALNGTVFALAVPDTTPPQITCPNVTVACAIDLLVRVTYPAPTVSDNVDPVPKVTYSIPNGSGFPVGTTTVTGTATDAAGNSSHTSFNVTRAPLQFSGFLSPIGGSDTTGGSYSAPLRTFKAGSTIPVKFTAQCGGSPVLSGIHRLQAVKYTSATTAGTPIDATPQDAATTGDQFRLTSGQWQFNLDTKSTGMTTGIWLLLATLSDGSQHSVWVQIK